MHQRGSGMLPGFSGSDPPGSGRGSAMALRAQGHEDGLRCWLVGIAVFWKTHEKQILAGDLNTGLD